MLTPPLCPKLPQTTCIGLQWGDKVQRLLSQKCIVFFVFYVYELYYSHTPMK